MLLANYPQKDAEENFNHAAKQAYVAFSQAIAVVAFEEVNATSLEGFSQEEAEKILGLKEKGLRSFVMLPIGYTNSDKEWLASLKKVRKNKKDLITIID